MDISNLKVSVFAVVAAFLLTLHPTHEVRAWDVEYAVAHEGGPEFVPLDRHKRDVAPPAVPPANPVPPAAPSPGPVQPGTVQKGAVQPGTIQPGTVQPGTVQPGTVQPGTMQPVSVQPGTATPAQTPAPSQPPTQTAQNVTTAVPVVNATDDSNRTINGSSPPTPVYVTQIPLLGVNGSGIFKGNSTDKMPARVSDPILADDNITTINFEEQLKLITAQTNLTNLQYDKHIFYNSTFIGNQTYFQEHWANITKPKSEINPVLSNSHRRATTFKLSFTFPFYGHPLRNVTVATGGFLYTGEHVHNWLAATQYIAPLMANFDTTLTVDSCVKLFDDGEKFTALWENVNIREDKSKNFTFAVTLYKNGDIVFAYKDIPIPVQMINENDHPVKVGISDAYQTDRMIFYVRRKTIYEYHHVSYKGHNITNGTILRIVALPTCLQYNSCVACANHETEFNCSWCEQLQKCSSGTDRNKQDWMVRACDRTMIVNATQCPAGANTSAAGRNGYVTDAQSPRRASVEAPSKPEPRNTPVGAALGALAALALVTAGGAWLLYAFRHPHSRSGQMLIKYRPSQWSWRRGEARYTAATIHM